jgi:hypothetical protein
MLSWYERAGSDLIIIDNRGRLTMLPTRKCPFILSELVSFPLSHPLLLYDVIDSLIGPYELPYS